MEKNELARARTYVIWLLGRRDYSRRQLEQKLKLRDLNSGEIKNLLDGLIEDSWFSEDAFKRARTRQLLKRGLAPRLVTAELQKEKIKITHDEISAAFSEINLSAQKQLCQMIEKQKRRPKIQTLDKKLIKQKIVQALQRKGYSVSDILKHFNEDRSIDNGFT